jgi:hypothetical protein
VLTLLIMGCLFISSTHGMTFIRQLCACMVSLFLRDRYMVVEDDVVKSVPRYLSSGVPQGCIPSAVFIYFYQ